MCCSNVAKGRGFTFPILVLSQLLFMMIGSHCVCSLICGYFPSLDSFQVVYMFHYADLVSSFQDSGQTLLFKTQIPSAQHMLQTIVS